MRESPEARCRRNVECWLREIGAPTASIEVARSDRCLLAWSAQSLSFFEGNLDRWDLSIAAHQPFGVPSAKRGWRERRATWSAQVIEHVLPWGKFLEIDFDDANPNWGLALLIGHGIQWLRWRFAGYKTSPFAVAKHRGWDQPAEVSA